MSFDPSGLVFIFTAGVLTLVSPCGFPMLPGYVSYYLGAKASYGKTLAGGVVCTLGLLAVFSVVGVVAATFGSFVSQYIPLFEPVAGIIVIVMGVGLIVGIKFPEFIRVSKAPTQSGISGIFLYGLAYGLATMGCSAPIFFSILFYAVATGGFFYSTAVFIVYALGMGLPLVITAILVAKAKKFMLERMFKMTLWFQKIGGIILIMIGAYLIYFYLVSFQSV